MALLYLLFWILLFVCLAFLLRALNTFLYGRKYAHFSYLKESISRNVLFGVGIVPVFIILKLMTPQPFSLFGIGTKEKQVELPDATFLRGRYAVARSKGYILFNNNGAEQTINISYKRGATLNGNFTISNIERQGEFNRFTLNVTGNWQDKRKLTPYSHQFDGVLNNGMLRLISTYDQSVINAVRVSTP